MAQELEWTIEELLDVLPEQPHKLDSLVAAHMAKRRVDYILKGGVDNSIGETHFTIHDVTRILYQIYTAPNAAETLRGDTRIPRIRNGQPAESYLKTLQGFVAAIEKIPALNPKDIGEIIIPKAGRNLQKANSSLMRLARCISSDAEDIKEALLNRNPRKPYLERADYIESEGKRGTPYAYRLVL